MDIENAGGSGPRTWFTSDPHFGHGNIITYCRRPFHSVENMNKLLVMQWNEVVAPEDTVYVLGDVLLGRREEMAGVIESLNGTKLLIPGNHDRCWPGHKKVGTWPQRYVDGGFAQVLDPQVDLSHLFDMDVEACHFPFSGDSHDEDRYSSHRPEDRGQWLLHGHVHNAWRVRDRQINVGVDVWGYYPVQLETLRTIMLAGTLAGAAP